MPVPEVWQGLKRDGIYFDIACSPPFSSHHDIQPVYKEVLNSIPSNLNKVFAPFTFNASPFWNLGIEEAYLNHKWEGFTILFYVIRDHWRDLYDFVSGTMISTQDEYNEVLNQFNSTFKRILSGKGSGRERGLASEDEMIRMGSLFYILQKCCKQDKLLIDSDRMFLNDWNGKSTKITITSKELDHYSEKLKNVCMSGLDWKNFFFRYINDTDEQSLWFFNLPNAEEIEENCVIEKEFSYMEYFSLFDNMITISKRGGYIFAILEKDEETLEGLVDHFKFVSYGDYFKNNYFYLYPKFTDGVFEYAAITNYSLSDSNKFSKVKLY